MAISDSHDARDLKTYITFSATYTVCSLASMAVPRQHIIVCVIIIRAYVALLTDAERDKHARLTRWIRNTERTHKSWPFVASKEPLEPMFAAAMIWTAHPQSILATEATEPMVFESRKENQYTQCSFHVKRVDEHPTIQQSKFLHRGDESEKVQK